jgi:hypothetical protein
MCSNGVAAEDYKPKCAVDHVKCPDGTGPKNSNNGDSHVENATGYDCPVFALKCLVSGVEKDLCSDTREATNEGCHGSGMTPEIKPWNCA